jgi:hypothetical protein
MPVEQAGFRKGTRDQIANVRWVLKTTRENNKPVYLCFIDCAKAFDSVKHSKMWNSMRNMGVPEYLIGYTYTQNKKPKYRSDKAQQIGSQYKKV